MGSQSRESGGGRGRQRSHRRSGSASGTKKGRTAASLEGDGDPKLASAPPVPIDRLTVSDNGASAASDATSSPAKAKSRSSAQFRHSERSGASTRRSSLVAPTVSAGRLPSGRHRARSDGDHLVARYLQEISKVPLLTADQERALARRIEAGKIAEERLSVMGEPEPHLESELMRVVEDGLRAKRQMIEANLRLVVSIAKRYSSSGLALLDLIQEGNIGLIRAVERFDYRLGYRFSTYATWWIKQAIRRALSDQGRTVRIPTHVTDDAARVRKAYDALVQKFGEAPDPEEVAKASGISPDRVQELLSITHLPLSLDAPIGEDESTSLSEIICDDVAEIPQELVTKRLLREQMLWAMRDLTPRERQVLKMRFGLDGERPRTLEEVGRTISVTRERVRQIEARCLAKLRHPSRAKHLREYLQ